jgi:hypothetical protein
VSPLIPSLSRPGGSFEAAIWGMPLVSFERPC